MGSTTPAPFLLPASTTPEAAPSSSDLAFIDSALSTLTSDPTDLLHPFVHDFTTADLNLETLLMPPLYHPDSPSSSLSTPATQTSFEDSFSSASSVSLAYTTASTSPVLDKAYFNSIFFSDNFTFTNQRPLLPTANPFIEDIKSDSLLPLNSFESFTPDFQFIPVFKLDESIHRSIEVPASPTTMDVSTFSHPYVERTMPQAPAVRPFAHSFQNFTGSYVSTSSDDTTSDAPLPSPLPKKPARIAKQDKGIRCDHCGVDKTPLWRKVPKKENAYHCNACGLYYKSNGHFRTLEGEGRVIRVKKLRKPGDYSSSSSYRSGPVTANRNVTCANCGTNNTVLWRKGPDGQSPLCNPCGLFYKLHGKHRSADKKKEIHRRNRGTKKRYSISTVASRNSWSSAEEGDDEIDSPVTPEFTFQPQQMSPTSQQNYVKAEEMQLSSPTTAASTAGYSYQWQEQSV